MGIYIEALILYIILFFAGSVGYTPPETADFSVTAALYRIILYTIPSLALIWYLLLRNGDKEKPLTARFAALKPVKNDLISGLIAYPCLILTGLVTAAVSSFLNNGTSVEISVKNPESIYGWMVLGISCFFSAYLEESFFRYYLLSKRKAFKMGQIHALIFSTALFALCHLYEGPFGVLNSVISGGILAFLFIRYNSLHGISIAHGLYNITVFIINSQLMQPK